MDNETAEPQREPLHFHINLENLAAPAAEVVQSIKKVAEQLLFHWKTFPIILPPPLAVANAEGDSLNRKPKPLNLRDVFVPPSFDELELVALDVKCEPRRLRDKQLLSIKESGEFEVESINFPGQNHRWRLSQLLQKGTFKTKKTLLQDFALALRLIIITARNRLCSSFFSCSNSLKSLVVLFIKLLDIFFGVPLMVSKNLESRVKEERSKYLVTELTVRPNLEDDLDNLCQFVRHQIRKQTLEKYHLENEKPPPVPSLYQTPKGKEIDLRLYNKALIRQAYSILASILEKEARNWFLPFRERVIAELKTKKLSEEEIEQQASTAILDEYLHRVFASILSNPDIESIEPGLGQLLVEQCQAIILMHRAVDNIERKLRKHLDNLKRELELTHPLLSLISQWVRKELEEAEERFLEEHKWDAHVEAILLCKHRKLHQMVYFLQRDLAFMKEREPVLKKEFGRVRQPTRLFQWQTQIWCPRKWKVRRVFQGQTEVLSTVISQIPSASMAQPRADPNQPVFLVEKEKCYATSTQWPCWRWANYFFRTWSWTWNAMFLLGVVIPICSPVSLRALFLVKPFMPDLELSQLDGSLSPRKTSLTHTTCSRLFKLWRHISKSRTEFESRPDTGFVGKGFSRHLNRLWNYLVKGLFGTLGIVTLFPLACLVVSFASLLGAITAPIWVPVATFLFHLFMILVYDFDSPEESRNKICILLETLFWYMILLGILQPLAAFCIAVLLCPLAAVVTLLALVRCGLRCTWDAAIYHLIIKKRGRVPAVNSWMVKRIGGPGLSNNHYYRIYPEQALAALEARLESEELNTYKESVERVIKQPQHKYSEFVESCFRPFSATLSKEGVYLQLERQTQELLSNLREQVEGRMKELHSGLNVTVKCRIKLTSSDLQTTIRLAAVMLERFYPIHVFCRMPCPEQNFWEEKGLSYRDWPGLGAQLLSEVFSTDLLTPLDDNDLYYRLEVQGVSLNRYQEMLQTIDEALDIDVSNTIHTPKGNIHVHAPYLDITSFNPLSNYINTVNQKEKSHWRYPWKKPKRKPVGRVPSFASEKLMIPLPIPHPAEIAVIIFNRENEDPVPIEHSTCQDVLKAIQDGCRNSSGVNFDNGDLSPAESRSLTNTEDERGPALRRSPSVNIESQEMRRGSSLEEDDSDDRVSRTTYSQRTSGSIVVNLASTEDISIEPDGQRVTYSHSSYSTTV